jgi:hypothetical protein
MVGNDRSIVNAPAIITTIAVTHYTIIALKQRYPAFGRVVDSHFDPRHGRISMQFALEPRAIGLQPLTLRIAGGEELRLSMLVLP